MSGARYTPQLQYHFQTEYLGELDVDGARFRMHSIPNNVYFKLVKHAAAEPRTVGNFARVQILNGEYGGRALIALQTGSRKPAAGVSGITIDDVLTKAKGGRKQ